MSAGIYVAVGDCVKVLGVSREIVYRLIDSGRLEAIRTPGGHRRVLRSSIEKLRLEQGTGDFLAESQRKSWRNARGASARVTSDGGAQPRMSVLLVDDDLVSLTWLKHLVSHEFPQLTIATASDAEMAFETLEQDGCPDIVITDLNMPGDGFRLAWAIHVRPEYQRALVIATTALDAREIHEAGGLPDRVIQLAKPVQPGTLLKLLEAALLLRSHLRARIH